MISFMFVDTEQVWRGGQDQLMTLLRGLHQRGHEINLICHPKSLLEERAREAGIRVHPVAMRSEAGLIAFFRLQAILRRTNPEILAFNTPRPILLAGLASRLAAVKVRMIFRRVNFPLRRNPLTRLKYRWGIDCIVAISESIRRQLEAGGVPSSKIRTVYEGMDISIYPKLMRPERRTHAQPVIVGTIAHLSPEKGLTYLIKAAAGIPNVRSRIQFVVVGDGECREQLETEVQAFDLASCFRFLGFQTRTAEHLRSFDIFVLPSLSEGLSSAILAAMASSLPVIATQVGGIPELIQNEVNGLLVPPGNSAALRSAIERLESNLEERQRMGQAGRSMIEDRFTLRRKIIETEELCTALLCQKIESPKSA
jgi:glycosyltransferase involved in cell wall biosynthesis